MLAEKGKPVGGKLLEEIATLASPETILRWLWLPKTPSVAEIREASLMPQVKFGGTTNHRLSSPGEDQHVARLP
jgi:hypothetical protein